MDEAQIMLDQALESKRKEISDAKAKLLELEEELLVLEKQCSRGGEHEWDYEHHGRSHITKICKKCGKKEIEYMGGRRKSRRRKKRRRKKRSRRRNQRRKRSIRI